MMFRRRHRPSLLSRLRNFVWPRRGFRRAATYVGYRLIRLPGSPYAIAGGFAWGVAVSFTPFIGLHIALAIVAAWLGRCSLLAATIGTAIGNPWTFPFIWAWIYTCGAWIMGGDTDRPAPLEGLRLLFQGLWQRLGDAVGLATGMVSEAPQRADEQLSELALDVLLPMSVGAVPNVVVVWLLCYLPLRRLVAAYQQRRAARRRKHWRTADGEAN